MVTIKFFQAEWCGPCKEQKPIVKDLDEKNEDLTVEEFDVEDDQDEANKFQVRSVPTLVILTDDGTVQKRFSGLTQPDDIKQALDTARNPEQSEAPV